MQISDWYLQGLCIRRQRCVAWWNHGNVTFALGPVTFDPEIIFLSLVNIFIENPRKQPRDPRVHPKKNLTEP
jgi:hypothetical protein